MKVNKYIYPLIGVAIAGGILMLSIKSKKGDDNAPVEPTPEESLRQNDSGRVTNAKQKISAMKAGLNVFKPTTIRVLKSDGSLGNTYNVRQGKLYSKEYVKGVRKDGYIIVRDEEVGGNFFGFGSFESDVLINPYFVIAI
jgi:hypothetical protein